MLSGAEPRPGAPKVTLRLVSIGLTPAIAPNVLTILGDRTMAAVSQFLRRRLRTDAVHLYIHNTFEPTPDEHVADLWRAFGTGAELIVSYCLQVAFG
jgi:ubiquitin-like protein ATG12